MNSPQNHQLIHISKKGNSHKLELAIGAWLHAKGSASGSRKTLASYSSTLAAFRLELSRAGLDLDSPDPTAVALVAQAFAGAGAGGSQVAPATYNLRLAILSSFYKYAIKMGLLAGATGVNPLDRVGRRKVQAYRSATALTPAEVKAKLAAIDRSPGQLAGQRDYCLLMVALTTGRRLAEVAGLRLGDVQRVGSGKPVELLFRRCKGGKQMRDVLSAQVAGSLLEYLKELYSQLYTGGEKPGPDAPLWTSLQQFDGTFGQPLSAWSLAQVCEKRLGTSKFHSLRHTFAHTMEEAGAKVSDIQARLGHESLATTGRYLAALKNAENEHADLLADLFGS